MQPLFLRALKAQLVLLITSMMFFTTGCEDDDHDHDEDHTDAEGFVLENESETEVYKEFEGAIVTNNLTLSVGDTLELSVHFLDHDGEEIEHEEDGEEEEGLWITGNNESIAIVESEEHEEGEEEHHEMAIHVIGVSIGSTDFKLELMHDDHADYTSTNNVQVTVTSGN
ncbi:MAG: hypothetical protein HOK52_07175 [Candidatus Marinimicrobia bacterium]|jgi:activator of 2-hydroxyglutaryl-CoA dehydratase|nr:hypothetical protein [Candidatus Neomarinimicrobiota bacterium]MBT3936924.1 hypothetical protein [Candidatus Neomarinimicrobiota bacterium]MBT3960652.1 hypothetical protein [Candidatus Neomarinimicrobiota bacterium]MBT4636322.1 hypothetical protein [Candidatus Neomarinimicrobiota bacterium]MBT4684940.1 hypothetical protein [Candidatus Neomarinimicrobiota bacterium]